MRMMTLEEEVLGHYQEGQEFVLFHYLRRYGVPVYLLFPEVCRVGTISGRGND